MTGAWDDAAFDRPHDGRRSRRTVLLIVTAVVALLALGVLVLHDAFATAGDAACEYHKAREGTPAVGCR